jgi:hypothetical protein
VAHFRLFVPDHIAVDVAALIVQSRCHRVKTEGTTHLVAVFERKNVPVATGRVKCDTMTDGEPCKSGTVDVGELAHSVAGLWASAADFHEVQPFGWLK